MRASGEAEGDVVRIADAFVPLAGHEVLRTRDVDEARGRVGEVFCPHELLVNGDASRFEARHNVLPLGSVALCYLDYHAEVRLTPQHIGDFVLIHLPLDGAVDTLGGARERVLSTPTLATVAQPDEPFRMHWKADSPHLLVRFDATELQHTLWQMVGVEPAGRLRFTLGQDLRTPHMRSWGELIKLVCQQADDDRSAAFHPLNRRHLEQLITTGFLLGTHHTFSEQLHEKSTRPPVPRRLQTAIDYLHAHARQSITIDAAAAAAGIGIRALQAAFQLHLNTTPTAYFRRIRLDGVRRELENCDPQRTTVTDTATQWGFTHLSRFSADYRNTFGETPRQTLRGRRKSFS